MFHISVEKVAADVVELVSELEPKVNSEDVATLHPMANF